jgi:hypothetical protein
MTDELKAATVAPSPWDQATLSINGNKVERGTAPCFAPWAGERCDGGGLTRNRQGAESGRRG